MKKIHIILIGLIIMLALGFISYRSFLSKGESLGITTARLTHPSFNFDQRVFYQGVNQAKNEPKPFSDKISGGIVPHHTVASFMIANFFSQLAKQNPKTLILIGPNHEELGSFKSLTSQNGWETPFGVVDTDAFIVSELVQQDLAREDDKTLSGEHSVAALMPYIKYYLPDVKIVPIIIKSSLTLKDSEELSQFLSQRVDDNSLLIASVDFSHYLTSDIAEEKDVVTIELIKQKNFIQLFTLNSDYLDSPGSIATLLMTMKNKQTENLSVVDHANSGGLQNNKEIPTTSYYVLTFH